MRPELGSTTWNATEPSAAVAAVCNACQSFPPVGWNSKVTGTSASGAPPTVTPPATEVGAPMVTAGVASIATAASAGASDCA
jgi:hypothetical protein